MSTIQKMEVFRIIIEKATNPLSINLPDTFQNKTLEVIIFPIDEDKEDIPDNKQLDS